MKFSALFRFHLFSPFFLFGLLFTASIARKKIQIIGYFTVYIEENLTLIQIHQYNFHKY